MKKKYDIKLDLLHYLVLFILLSVSWTTAMDFFDNLALTWIINLFALIIFDKAIHKYILGE